MNDSGYYQSESPQDRRKLEQNKKAQRSYAKNRVKRKRK